jgi:hypothetical protein
VVRGHGTAVAVVHSAGAAGGRASVGLTEALGGARIPNTREGADMTTNTEVHEWLDRRRRVAMGEARRYRERDPERAARARRRVTAIERVGEVLRNRPGGRSVGSLVRSRGRAEYRRDDSARRLRRRGETVARECLSLQGVQSGQRGDCYTFGVLEVAPPLVARGTYQATAGSMALVLVTRVRRYANSYHYGPSEARTVYLCGYDHGGPYAHPVHRDCRTIAAALQWAWQGYWPQVR